jgi:hypothetical protein
MNLISQRLRRLRTSDPSHIRVLQQIEDEWHIQAMLRYAADSRPPGKVVRPCRRGGLAAQLQPVDDAATEHHVGQELTNDFGRMVILQRRSETPRRLWAEPDLLEERLNVMVLE